MFKLCKFYEVQMLYNFNKLYKAHKFVNFNKLYKDMIKYHQF